MAQATQRSSATIDLRQARRGRVARIEVRWKEGFDDPLAAALLRHAHEMGLAPSAARSAKVYLIEGDVSDEQLRSLVEQLLVNPVVEEAFAGAAPTPAGACTVEVHPLPGVMNPTALTVAQQARELFGAESVDVATGWRCDVVGLSQEQAERVVRTAPGGLCNPVVHAILREPLWPEALPHGRPREPRVQRVQLRGLDDEQLLRLSREGHLFLSLEEMRAVQAHFGALGRDPTDVELETIAQTWSEHCVHKTLKSTIRYECPGESRIDFAARPGVRVEGDGVVVVDNLLRRTIAHATHRLIEEGLDWTLSVFEDNAGVIAFDEQHGVCVKVETHNHPSAIEPYGGAATGVGGCIRDILGTGLGARPIAATDVFCTAPPEARDVPAGCLPPRRILTDVVAGVRDYGNRMGVPTVAGAVFFDERYVGNPLVYCGCVGIMPRSMVRKEAQRGDLIVVLGGRTGRDGVHGATFSSAQLESGHAEEFSHAVQIGNPIEERKVHDALLRARDAKGGPLFTAVTDCGAGGFSSAIGEMGAKIGAEVDLARAPLKYEGLSPAEIWISEAQERMVLAVPPDKLEALQRICDEESVELAVLGTFGTDNAELIVRHGGLEAARLSMAFLHEGLPRQERFARSAATPVAAAQPTGAAPVDLGEALLRLLAHPDVASKRWIVRQYDHEVQGDTVLKPLVGAAGDGPG
ncbi:MAG: phosphoribosylformylglycinamidine synthase, partial [Planctomycetota bacterium]